MANEIDFSEEAGKFVGSFAVTTLFGIIDKIFTRKHKSADEIVESVKDWKWLIDSLDLYKRIHNLAQEFIDRKNLELFDNVKKYLEGPINTDGIKKLKSHWEKEYFDNFQNEVEEIKNELYNYAEKAKTHPVTGLPDLGSYPVDKYTLRCVNFLATGVPDAHSATAHLINSLNEAAQKTIGMPNLAIEDIENAVNDWLGYQESILTQAHRVLGRTDAVLIRLIHVLGYLYVHTVQVKQ